MKHWNDKTQFICPGCGHKWILIADKKINNVAYKIWMVKVFIEHEKLQLDNLEG